MSGTFAYRVQIYREPIVSLRLGFIEQGTRDLSWLYFLAAASFPTELVCSPNNNPGDFLLL